jgi:hypothetical protein
LYLLHSWLLYLNASQKKVVWIGASKVVEKNSKYLREEKGENRKRKVGSKIFTPYPFTELQTMTPIDRSPTPSTEIRWTSRSVLVHHGETLKYDSEELRKSDNNDNCLLLFIFHLRNIMISSQYYLTIYPLLLVTLGAGLDLFRAS